MVLVMMLGVMIALGSESGPEAVVDPGYNAGLTLLVTILVVALAPVPGIVLSATVRPENLSDPYRRARTLRRVRVGTACYQGYLLAAYAFVTWVLDWPVRMAPGQMLRTRMRNGATSWAMLFIISITPPFDAA